MKKYILAIITGITVGMLTLIGQKYLPINLNFLANSGAVWLIPAFLVSLKSHSEKISSVSVCVMCLLCCVFGYYGFETIVNRHSFEMGYYTWVWIGCAVVGGVIFGIGAWVANNKEGLIKYGALDLLPAVFLAEGIYKVIHISGYRHMVPGVMMIIAIGVILFLVVNKKQSLSGKAIFPLLVLTAFGLFVFEVVY